MWQECAWNAALVCMRHHNEKVSDLCRDDDAQELIRLLEENTIRTEMITDTGLWFQIDKKPPFLLLLCS